VISTCALDPELLALLSAGGILPILKQDDPLERGDFERRMLALATLLANAMRPSDGAKIADLRRVLNRDWVDLDDGERAAAVRRAAEVLRRLPGRVGQQMIDRAERAAVNMEQRAREQARRRFDLDIPARLPAALQSESQRLVEPLPEFVEEEFDRRSNFFLIAGVALATGLIRQGKSNEEITARLIQAATSYVQRPAYSLALSAVVLNRARTAALLNAYDEAGIIFYRVQAELDTRTCRKCRFMHGKRFSVGDGLDLVRGVARSRSPQRIEQVNPFLREGVDGAGRPIIFVQTERGRRVLAREIERGGKGERGRFGSEAAERTLTALGIGPPPYHPLCRCQPVRVSG
jgi:hypothetical protein